MDEKCTVSMGVTHFTVRLCGKPAKGYLANGEPACGVHLAAERKRKASEARWRQEWADNHAFRDIVKAFGERSGWAVAAKCPEEVVIKFADLVALYEELEGYRGR